jgi:hypothetical protein
MATTSHGSQGREWPQACIFASTGQAITDPRHQRD